MFKTIKKKAFNAKTAVGGALLTAVTAPAFAADVAAITAGVESSLADAKTIAGAVVLGLFAIWGVKLLMRGK